MQNTTVFQYLSFMQIKLNYILLIVDMCVYNQWFPNRQGRFPSPLKVYPAVSADIFIITRAEGLAETNGCADHHFTRQGRVPQEQSTQYTVSTALRSSNSSPKIRPTVVFTFLLFKYSPSTDISLMQPPAGVQVQPQNTTCHISSSI